MASSLGGRVLRRGRAATAWPLRLVTAPRRVLPNVLVVGTMKGGTTSLHAHLAHHPDLHPPCRKEVHYFDGQRYDRWEGTAGDVRWYRAHFPLASEVGPTAMAFEATAAYLYHPDAPARIRALMPDVRLVAVLRDPVERAVSHYFHERRRGREPLDLMPALEAEEERLRSPLARGDHQDMSFVHHSYKARGRYHEQLVRYHEHFDREQLLVLRSEDLFARPRETIREVLRFVGVDDGHLPDDLSARYVGGNRRDVPEAVVASLREHFRPHNARLAELLGRDLGWA